MKYQSRLVQKVFYIYTIPANNSYIASRITARRGQNKKSMKQFLKYLDRVKTAAKIASERFRRTEKQ